MKLSVKVDGAEVAAANVLRKGEKFTKAVRDEMLKQGFALEAQAKQSPPTPVDTGRLRGSISTNWSGSGKGQGKVGNPAKTEDGVGQPDERDKQFAVVVGTNVEYACVVGSQQQVYDPSLGTSANIGNYPYDYVLSKDGQPHSILKKHRFYSPTIQAVSIRTRKGRNPLIVTGGHLLLVQRGDKIFWEEAININPNDRVFIKRSHNSISDNSNKKKFSCFCGRDFYVEKYIIKYREPKYCSLECRHRFGPHDQNTGKTWRLNIEQKDKRHGKNNSAWKDGASLMPYPAEFNDRLKMFVKERDRYQCRFCGKDGNLVVHHIDGNKFNNEPENLLTLCSRCHGNLNKQDCELPAIDMTKFTDRPILELKYREIRRVGKPNIPALYDLTIKDENSFVVSGVLVHNSFVEFGTSRMSARRFMFRAWAGMKSHIIAAIAEAARQEVARK